jgi:2-keto-4-pentenoate hydratase/2-oxohepta-3-ene-1,7-dioic acid hydratase in catechol pathway
MLICRYAATDGPSFGIVENDAVYALRGDMFTEMRERGARVGSLHDLTLLPPTVPSKIVCVGRNYAAHAKELGNEVPEEPLLFFKPPSALIGHGEAIRLLPQMGKVDHEAELAVVIGREAHNVLASEASNYVLGYTCANDVSDRDFQKKDGQWTRAKGFDTFCPLGPWINTTLDPHDVAVLCSVNGEPRQIGRTSQLIFDIPSLIAYISAIMTLMPGDLVLTGTPAGVGAITSGDVVEVSVEGIGELRNPVIFAESPASPR